MRSARTIGRLLLCLPPILPYLARWASRHRRSWSFGDFGALWVSGRLLLRLPAVIPYLARWTSRHRRSWSLGNLEAQWISRRLLRGPLCAPVPRQRRCMSSLGTGRSRVRQLQPQPQIADASRDRKGRIGCAGILALRSSPAGLRLDHCSTGTGRRAGSRCRAGMPCLIERRCIGMC